MGPLLLLALAVGPVLILLHAIYFADRYEKEPIRNLLRYCVVGALLCVPAYFAERGAGLLFGEKVLADPGAHPIGFVVFVFLGIALVEESLKLWALRRLARRDAEIDEPFDWVVYAVTVSLGFATLENVLYVFGQGAVVGVARAFTAVPAHALNATFMGDRLARAALADDMQLTPGVARRERILALAEPTIWHGLYDVCAAGSGAAAQAGERTLSAILAIGLFALILLQWVLGILRVRSQQRASGDLHARGLAHRGGRRSPPIFLGLRKRA